MTATNELSAPPEQADHAPSAGIRQGADPNRPRTFKPKRNPRSLRKRIRRVIYTSSVISILLYSIVILVVLTQIFRPLSNIASEYIGNSIAKTMNSPMFLGQMGIESLEQFDETKPIAREWMKNYIESTAKQDSFYFSMGLDDKGKIAGPSNEDFIYIQLKLKDRTIYSNNPEMDRVSENHSLTSRIIKYYTVTSYHSLMDKDGNVVGGVTVGINPKLGLALLTGIAVIIGVLLVLCMLVSMLLSKLFTIPIITPIDTLVTKMRAVSQDDFETTMNTAIRLNRPLYEIESLANSTNEIVYKMKGYTDLLKDQNDELEAQNEELEAQKEELIRSKEQIELAQSKLTQREKSLRNLLNNAGQGFLSFGGDLLVAEEYSLECVAIFGSNLAGRSFPELLAQGDEEQQTFLTNLFARIFAEQDPGKREIYVPLLLDELKIGGRYIHIDYKMIPASDSDAAEQCMVILTDVTEKRSLQSQMEQERNTLKMVVKVVVDYSDYADLVREFQNFHEEELYRILERDAPVQELLSELFRELHTFKGSFSQFGLTQMVRKLHNAESLITELTKRKEELSARDIRHAVLDLRMDEWLAPEQSVLRAILGEAFLGQENVLFIDKTKIVEIEKKMVTLLSPADCKVLLPELRKLRYKPFREMLRTYPEYTGALAERLDKMLAAFQVEGGDFLCDTETYSDFSRSLVHVFRNIVDHGIEPPDERIRQGKDEIGRVTCSASLEDGCVVLDIADDGRGISLEALRERAAQRGFLTQEQAAEANGAELMDLIFREQFSTKTEVTELSGRGIGLSSVKYEVERLGGSIEVHTAPGGGTRFRFLLPYIKIEDIPQLSVLSIMEPLTDTAVRFFEDQTQVRLEADAPFQLYDGDKLSLASVTSFINVSGALSGMFVLSLEDELAKSAVRSLVYGEVLPDEEEKLMEDTLAEASNIILGNSIHKFPDLEEYIVIDPPITMFTTGASMKYSDAEIWTCKLRSEQGALQLSFVVTKKFV